MATLTNSFPPLRNAGPGIAVVDGNGRFSYADVRERSERAAASLLGRKSDIGEERIAMLLPAELSYVTTMHGIWLAGGIAVPLNVGSSTAELEHYLGNAGVTRLVTNDEYAGPVADLCRSLGIDILLTPELEGATPVDLPEVDLARRAMIIFTSGTTSKPKGVVSTHGNIAAQVTCLLDAWRWSEDDRIPLPLPLHHVHGIINILSCALWAGAGVHMHRGFDAGRLVADVAEDRYTLFMAVPTIYAKLIEYLGTLPEDEATRAKRGFRAMRLNVSGSAACPVTLFERWQALTGQVLLERYGMTEIGMALSNPYDGERRAGHVGQALPGVEVALYAEDGSRVDEAHTGGGSEAGEIRVRGPNVFLEYWNNPEATRESFTDGWFRTGDIAVVEDGYFRILGRASIDIIKSGGYKLSALEIEGVLLTHEAIHEVAVAGEADETWGEVVVAYLVCEAGREPGEEALRDWCLKRMSRYKVPRRFEYLTALPRNAMGKVTKSALGKRGEEPRAVEQAGPG